MKDGKTEQFQRGVEQYPMPKALKKPMKGHYRVGYGATTGNNTSLGKKTEE